MGLTQRKADTAKPKAKTYEIWDDRQAGGSLGLRVNAGGRKSWVLTYRAGGRHRKPTIATLDQMTLAQARRRASEILLAVRSGKDPQAAKEERREAITVDAALDEWFAAFAVMVADGQRKERTLRDYQDHARRVIRPTIGKMLMVDVTADNIERVLDKVGGKGSQRNQVRAGLSSFFKWAESRRVRHRQPGTNPTPAVGKDTVSQRRRILEADEREAFMAALAADPNRSAATAIRFMLESGLRVNEARLLRWDEVDMIAGIAVLADTKTGVSRRPLSPEAIDTLAALRLSATGPFVFAGHREGHPNGTKQMGETFRRACRAAQIEDLMLLDMRRTFASDAIAAGVPLNEVQAAMGHTDLQMISQVYQGLGNVERLGPGLARIAAYREARATGKVVDLPRKTA